MRILIVGGGEVGLALSRRLAAEHDVTVVERDPRVAERFAALDVSVVTGSGTDPAALTRAGIAEAELLVACTGVDEVNLVTCTLGRQLGSPATICLVSRDEFFGPQAAGDALRRHFGVDRVLWPEGQLAADIERVIEAPGAIDAESFAEGQVVLLEYRLQPDAYLTDGPLSAVGLPVGSLVVAFKRGDTVSIPRGNTRLTAGDKVIIMGTLEAMRSVEARLAPEAVRAATRQKVTIIGGGDVGSRLAQHLDARPTVELRVIEKDPKQAEQLAATLAHALVLHGDGTDLELLEAEDIGRSDVLVSVIDNDERNLFASLLCRQLGAQKIITRVSKPSNLRLFERVGIDVALSARGAAVASIVHQVRGGTSNLLAVLEEGQAQVLEITVPATFAATTLYELGAPEESIVGAIRRDGDVIVPRGRDAVRPGDRLLVFTTAAAVDRVRDFFTAESR